MPKYTKVQRPKCPRTQMSKCPKALSIITPINQIQKAGLNTFQSLVLNTFLNKFYPKSRGLHTEWRPNKYLGIWIGKPREFISAFLH